MTASTVSFRARPTTSTTRTRCGTASEKANDDGYLTDLLADRAVSTVEDFARARTPFLISLHFNAPHWPWEGPEDEANRAA